jgi:bifunctional UDP-N-acetylglucosamine pyrophosphorylase / glucosamine-1-phosphate N-acetyltransferase
MPCTAIILAGGYGTLRDDKSSKLFEEVYSEGPPMITAVVAAPIGAGCTPCVVVVSKHHGEQIQYVLRSCFPKSEFVFVEQENRLGTGDAALAAIEVADIEGHVVVLNGDMPCWESKTIREVVAMHVRTKATITTGVVELDSDAPDCVRGFARFERDGGGKIRRIIENRDLTDEQRVKLTSANPALMVLDSAWCRRELPNLPTHPPKKNDGYPPEHYITDLVEVAYKSGLTISEYAVTDPYETLGVNTTNDLEILHKVAKERRRSVSIRSKLIPVAEGGHNWINSAGEAVCGFGCGAWSEEFASDAPLTNPHRLCPNNTIAQKMGVRVIRPCADPHYPTTMVLERESSAETTL